MIEETLCPTNLEEPHAFKTPGKAALTELDSSMRIKEKREREQTLIQPFNARTIGQYKYKTCQRKYQCWHSATEQDLC